MPRDTSSVHRLDRLHDFLGVAAMRVFIALLFGVLIGVLAERYVAPRLGVVLGFASDPGRARAPARELPDPNPAREVSVRVESWRINAAKLPEAQVLVLNSGEDMLDISVNCAFLGPGGAAIDNAPQALRSVAPGSSARASVTSSAQYAKVENVECRVESARINW